jgi:uncharacterized membrane protein
MSVQNEQLWTCLLQAAVVEGESPEYETLDSPWYVKVLLAFSGWLAALFLLGFVGIGFEFIIDNNAAAFIAGVVMIGIAFSILRLPKNEFFEHLGLAVSLAGQALVIWSIFDSLEHQNTEAAWLLIAVFQLTLAITIPNFVHRVFSSFSSVIGFSIALVSFGAPYIISGVVLFITAYLWLNEFRYPQHIRKIQAIAYGLVLALIPLKNTTHGYSIDTFWRSSNEPAELLFQAWMGEALTAAVLFYVVWQLLRRHGQAISSYQAVISLLAAFILSAVSMEAQGITIGVVILLLGFANSNRVLLGLGIVSILFYISSYYYQLDTSLLSKSATLLTLGLSLLISRWLVLRFIPQVKEPTNV